jgi:DNA helicase-2/ATP-dependent DNA helicase PcrA
MLHGQTRYNLPSRFLEEIPAGLLKWLTPKIARGGYAARPVGGYAAGAKGGYATEPLATYSPTPRASTARAGIGFRIGQSVRHAKFGQGVIVNAEGGGTDARVQVNFRGAGMKWLALSVAKLEPA